MKEFVEVLKARSIGRIIDSPSAVRIKSKAAREIRIEKKVLGWLDGSIDARPRNYSKQVAQYASKLPSVLLRCDGRALADVATAEDALGLPLDKFADKG